VAQTKAEKRSTRRFSMQLPVAMMTDGAPELHEARTKDVSARGVFFYLDSKPAIGTEIEFMLTLPAEITLTEDIRVRCKGKVVRVEDKAAPQVGVAAEIEQYDFEA
jgi:hypothetical protein